MNPISELTNALRRLRAVGRRGRARRVAEAAEACRAWARRGRRELEPPLRVAAEQVGVPVRIPRPAFAGDELARLGHQRGDELDEDERQRVGVFRALLVRAIAADRGLERCALCGIPTLELIEKLTLNLLDERPPARVVWVVLCRPCLEVESPELVRTLDSHWRT